ncbi:hypothetical protein TorRG33x02_020630 [Trema orientale]|uniref:Uncharacterized protein n=1 Tax=Trema orientale TaxID=63057 RepID=A0A2P5FWX6_TREOI|nr:hypothetical protein TorRG33x02_020630 [Trema orientale]
MLCLMKSLSKNCRVLGTSFQLGAALMLPRPHSRSGLGTRIWNLSDKPVELQIRVGSILKKVHTLKPGSSKTLKCKTIYKAFMPGGNINGGMRSLLYYYDDTGGDNNILALRT